MHVDHNMHVTCTLFRIRLGGQIIHQKRKKGCGEGEERGLRKGTERG